MGAVEDFQKHADLAKLMKAAASNDFATIATLAAQKNIDLDAKDAAGRTALLHAVETRSEEAALMLIHHKADVTIARAPEYHPPLILACQKGMQQLIERLVTVNAPLDTQSAIDGDTALMKAIRKSDGWAACRLVSAGADTETIKNKNGDTAWTLAHQYLETTDFNFFKGLVEKQRRQRADAAAQALAENVRDATVLQNEIKPLKRLHFRPKG